MYSYIIIDICRYVNTSTTNDDLLIVRHKQYIEQYLQCEQRNEGLTRTLYSLYFYDEKKCVRQRQTDRQGQRDKNTETERDKATDSEREKETDRQTELIN